MQDFKNLHVWRRAHALALGVDACIHRFPRKGSASLRSQLSRAADSVAANIVEGCGAASQREFARYLDIAIKSASEVEYHLITARDRLLMPRAECDRIVDEIAQVRRMLYGLRNKVLVRLVE
jgi:four helix bundle protein